MLPTNNVNESLDKLIEECAEVIHAASKAKRFGLDNFHPETRKKNSVALLLEILDMQEAVKDIRKYISRPSIKEMADAVEDWFNKSPLRAQQEFKEEQFDSLIIYHSSLGRQIRNEFGLWHYVWKEKMVNGVDTSEEHPDNISMKVIEEVWRRVQND